MDKKAEKRKHLLWFVLKKKTPAALSKKGVLLFVFTIYNDWSTKIILVDDSRVLEYSLKSLKKYIKWFASSLIVHRKTGMMSYESIIV